MGDPWTRKEVIGDCTLYLGDCLEVMPSLGKVDACLTDPPYGIGESGGDKSRRRGYEPLVIHEDKGWDKSRPQKKVFDAIQLSSNNQIIWGGNYFADMLPPSMGWLYWDKKMGGDFSDGELAWTSRRAAVRDFSKSPFAGLKGGHLRQHPTQKPVALMEWCLGFLPNAETILDPFMGSGTTLVACAKLGRKGIGIELDPDYFEIACKRVQEAYDQPDLFVAPPTPPTQEGMDL
jgi:DNA modification methylase